MGKGSAIAGLWNDENGALEPEPDEVRMKYARRRSSKARATCSAIPFFGQRIMGATPCSAVRINRDTAMSRGGTAMAGGIRE